MIADLHKNSGISQFGKWVNKKTITSYINDINKVYNDYLKKVLEEKNNPTEHGIDSWLNL